MVTSLVKETWTSKEDLEIGSLRFLTVRLLRELMNMPAESEPDTYFTRSQIAIVKEAEALILSNLTRRITAKELAERFGVSESSFKFYVKGIGDSYLNYFRKKRMEKAAELLESTTMKIIEVANAVGYENQGKFAKKPTASPRWNSDDCPNDSAGEYTSKSLTPEWIPATI